MTLRDIAEALGLEIVTGAEGLDVPVVGGYVGDLLSNVLAAAKPGQLWITIQHHMNVVGVAQVAELAGVLLAAGVQPSDAVIAKAREAGVPMLRGATSAFELSGRLYALLEPPC